jgi:hypothetical protein
LNSASLGACIDSFTASNPTVAANSPLCGTNSKQHSKYGNISMARVFAAVIFFVEQIQTSRVIKSNVMVLHHYEIFQVNSQMI